jgi:hypothetical protein
MPRVQVEKSKFTLAEPMEERPTRANFWLEKEGFAPTYVGGLLPGVTDRTVVLQRGVQVSGKVERIVNGKRVPVDHAALELRCLGGDLDYQRLYFRHPLETAMQDGGDLGFRQTIFSEIDGQYVFFITPPPSGKQWFLVCLDEAVTLDVRAGQLIKGPDFTVTVQVEKQEPPTVRSGARAP